MRRDPLYVSSISLSVIGEMDHYTYICLISCIIRHVENLFNRIITKTSACSFLINYQRRYFIVSSFYVWRCPLRILELPIMQAADTPTLSLKRIRVAVILGDYPTNELSAQRKIVRPFAFCANVSCHVLSS